MSAESFQRESIPEKPEGKEQKSFKQQVKEMLRAADDQVTRVLSKLGLIEKDLKQNEELTTERTKELEALKNEAQQAW